jgi:UDPglucose 6-dehydrogenase
MMKVTVFGSGYVGLVTGACLSDVGHEVVCVDVDQRKIDALQRGEIPIFEPGLDALITKNVKANRLSFTTDAERGVSHGEAIFIAVGTPPGEDGSADLKYVLAVAETIGSNLDHDAVVITKSTVPVGTGDKVTAAIARARESRPKLRCHVVSNPEFLREGAAIADFAAPDRIIVGAADPAAFAAMDALYEPYLRNGARMIHMDVRSAELAKYASNAMLATRISFMNELASVAEAVGADIEQIRIGMGSDPRIGPHFLNAGCGYGGSCFPKDVKALVHTGVIDAGLPMSLLQAVESVNAEQKRVLVKKLCALIGDSLHGKAIALWGLAFKPQTDDMREATSLVVIEELLALGATVVAFDPVATTSAQRVIAKHDRLSYATSPAIAASDADAILLVTEWKQFQTLPLAAIAKTMRRSLLIDGRNCIDPRIAQQAGFEYHGVGRSVPTLAQTHTERSEKAKTSAPLTAITAA